MAHENKSYRFNRSQIIFEQFEDETVLVNIESGYYYSLSPSGAEILDLIEEGIPADQLARALFGDSERAARFQSQLASFVDQLAVEGIVVECLPENAAAAYAGSPRYSADAAYQPPSVERFDDVRDLLLIDPIHEVDPGYGWPKKSSVEDPVEPRI